MKNKPDPYGLLEDLQAARQNLSNFYKAVLIIITTAICSAVGSAAMVLMAVLQNE